MADYEPRLLISRNPTTGQWRGVAIVQTPKGPICVVASADEGAIREELQRGGAAAGGLFSSIAKAVTSPVRNIAHAARELARGNVNAALRAGVRSALSATPQGMVPGATRLQERWMRRALPAVQAIAPATTFIPGAGLVAGPALMGATRMLARAYQGDPSAKQKIAHIRQLARGTGRAATQARRLASTFEGVLQQMNRAGVWRGFHQGGASAGATENGSWTTAQNGSLVFTPHAIAGGPLWDALRPRLGYRGESDALTTRELYRDGIDALSSL